MRRYPRPLADPGNGIDIVNASKLGDGGFECLYLLVPVRDIHSLDDGDFAILVELVCEGLGTLHVAISDEDLDAVTLLG
jgi:hypothetical protein